MEKMETLESTDTEGGPEVQDRMRRVPVSVRGANMRESRRRIPISQFYEQRSDVYNF